MTEAGREITPRANKLVSLYIFNCTSCSQLLTVSMLSQPKLLPGALHLPVISSKFGGSLLNFSFELWTQTRMLEMKSHTRTQTCDSCRGRGRRRQNKVKIKKKKQPKNPSVLQMFLNTHVTWPQQTETPNDLMLHLLQSHMCCLATPLYLGKRNTYVHLQPGCCEDGCFFQGWRGFIKEMNIVTLFSLIE